MGVPVPLPVNESARLAALARVGVLDTPCEEAFDRITRLAAQVLNVPCAAVNLLDAGRQFTKSCQGLGLAGMSLSREETPCAWTILSGGLLLIEDLSTDPRFRHHPLVGPAPAPGLRMYAGMPLVTPGGEALGTLCVFDTQARRLDAHEQEVLRSLAALVTNELERRTGRLELVHAREQTTLLGDLARLIDHPLAPEETARRALELLHAHLPLSWSGLLHLTGEGLEVRAEAGERGMALGVLAGAYAGRAGPALRAALERGEHLFLSGAPDGTQLLPELGEAGLRGVAWLHLPGGEEAPRALAVTRVGGPSAWTPGERLVLEAAARSVGVALERAEHVRSLERAALIDPLTGLGNRHAFDRALEEADRHHAATGTGYVLAVVDLDDMRRVNQEYGHARGDELLREFARQLQLPEVSAYRLGGDEYALLHPRPGLREVAAQALVNRVAGAVRFARSLAYPVGASVGVAGVPDDAPGATGALRAALRRMHAQKRARRATEYDR